MAQKEIKMEPKVIRYFVMPTSCTHWRVFEVLSDGHLETNGREVGDFKTRKEAKAEKERLNKKIGAPPKHNWSKK
jgi:hypothetical protein